MSRETGRFQSLVDRIRSVFSTNRPVPSIPKPPVRSSPERKAEERHAQGELRDLAHDLKSKFNVQRQSVYDHPTELAFLVSLLGRERRDHRPQISQTFGASFRLDETDLGRLDQAARDHLRRHIDVVPHKGVKNAIRMVATAHFPDRRTEVFDTLAGLSEEGSSQHNPDHITLRWTSPLRLPPGESAEVKIAFGTRGLWLADGNWADDASMILRVVSPNRRWVNETFDQLEPSLQALHVGGPAKPLQVFRNHRFVTAVAFVASGFAGAGGAFVILNGGAGPPSTGDAPRLLAAGIVFFVLVTGGRSLLADLLTRLAPASYIRVGLAGRKAERYEATFKYVALGILGLLVVLPALHALLTAQGGS